MIILLSRLIERNTMPTMGKQKNTKESENIHPFFANEEKMTKFAENF